MEDWRKAAQEEMARIQKDLMSKFKTVLRGSGRFIGIDDLCGTLVTRDPLPAGSIFEGTIIRIEEPVQTLMNGGALEIIIRKRTKNTLTAKSPNPAENQSGPQA